MSERRPSGASSALATLRSGDRLEGYSIERLLGVGGTACVYAATNREGHRVALKVLRDDRADDPESRRRFLHEARVGSGLHHPNIVRFVDFGSVRNQLFLAMELVQGTSLWSWVEEAPSAADVMDAFDQILDALAHAHARGVVHRDLKPDNILLEPSEGNRRRVRLVDFGVAHHGHEPSDDKSASSVVGTPEYMSPEQCLGSSTVSPASDLYAVGVMLFEIISGHLPFSGANTAATLLAHLRDPIPALVPRPRYEFDPAFEQVVRRLLAREPSARYLNAASARSALGSCRLFDHWEGRSPTHHRLSDSIQRVEPPPVTAGLFLVSDPPFVDLRGELHDLQHRAQTHLLRESQPLLTMISGAPGSGRSRLLRELAARLEEGGFAQIWQVELKNEQRAIDSLRAMAQQHYPLALMHPDDRKQRLEEQLHHDGFTDGEFSLAKRFLTTNDPIDTVSETPLWRILARIIEAASRRQRLVLVVEHLDHNDGELLLHLDELLDAHAHDGIVLLAAFRSDAETLRPRFAKRLEAFGERQPSLAVERRDLARLGLREMQRFLQRAVAVSPSTATLLADRADGNPSFALQMLRSILSRFGEQTLEDPVLLDRALAEIPDEIGPLLLERMESAWTAGIIPSEILRALEALAFLGMRIPRADALSLLEVEGVSAPGDVLTEMLAIPALGTIIHEQNGALLFEDRLTRAALMLRAERHGRKERLHSICADIKLRDKKDEAENIAEIAEHCMAAGHFTRARMLYYNAALSQMDANLWINALRHIDGAIRTVELDPNPNAADLADILLTRAELLSQLSRFPEAKKTLQALDRLRVFEDEEPNPQWMRIRAGVFASVDEDVDRAREELRHAARIADQRHLLVESIQARLKLAELHIGSGHLIEAEGLLRAALRLNKEHQNANLHAHPLVLLGVLAMLVGAYGEAREYALRAESLFESVQNRHGLAYALMIRGEIEHLDNNLPEAWDLLRRAQEEFVNIGDRRSAAISISSLGVVADAHGNDERARACWEQALVYFERLQEPRMIAMSKLRLAALDAHDGRWRSAGELLLDALVEHPKDPLHEMAWSQAMVRMAKEAILANRQALARDLLRRTLRHLENVKNESFLYDRIEEIAHLLYQLDEH